MTKNNHMWMTALLVMTVLLTACAGRMSARSLLNEDYAAMKDEELLVYYDQVSEAIESEAGGAGGFGLGLGLGVGSGSFSLGASQGMYVDDPTEQLRVRRNQVRLELARRGLQPQGPQP